MAWDFTVGSGARIAGRMLKLRDDAFAELGDTNLGDLTVQGDAPQFTPALPCVSSDPPDPDLLRVCGQFTVPCFLDQPGCPTGSRFAFADAKSNDPVRLPGQHDGRQLRVHRARRRHRRAPRALRPRPAGRGLRGRPAAAARDGEEPRLHLLRHRLEGDGDRGRADRRHDPQRPLALPGAHRPPAAGDPQLPLPRPADDPPRRLRLRPDAGRQDRHAAAVLRRQQPGRDLRRHADRGLARRRSARCSACRP